MLNKKYHKILDSPQVFNLVRHIIDGGQVSVLNRILKEYKLKSLLDVGCGTGDFAELDIKNYVGADLNERFINFAKKKYKKQFYVADVLKMKIEKQFDAILLACFIHHLSNKDVIKLLKDVAKKGKYVIILDNLPRKNKITKFFYSIDRGAHFRPLTKQIELVKKAGLDIVDCHNFVTGIGIYLHSVIICKKR